MPFFGEDRDATKSARRLTSVRRCSTSGGEVVCSVVAAIAGGADSITRLATLARSSREVVSAVDASTMRTFPGKALQEKFADEGSIGGSRSIAKQLLNPA